MRHRSGFGIWRCGVAALIATLPALLAEPGRAEESYGVEVLRGPESTAAPESAPAEPVAGDMLDAQEEVILEIDVPVTSLILENDRPRPDPGLVSARGWDPDAPARIRVHGANDAGPSRIRVHGWDTGGEERVRVHSWSSGNP